jgi:lysophospholipase L1-like esterase
MRKNSMLIIYAISVFATLLLISGFGLAVREISLPQTRANQPLGNQEKVEISKKGLLVGIGDSLTRGIGDSKGLGYIGRVKAKMEAENHSSLSFVNLAISGQTSPQLTKQLQDEHTKSLLSQASWIIFTIGGNDLFRGSGQLEKIDLASSAKSLVTYRQNITAILTNLRELNPNASIVMVGLYNPFSGMKDEQRTNHLVTEWNGAMVEISSHYPKVIVVPTYDLFQLNTKQYLSSDHFHPNDNGYERIANRVFQVINE